MSWLPLTVPVTVPVTVHFPPVRTNSTPPPSNHPFPLFYLNSHSGVCPRTTCRSCPRHKWRFPWRPNCRLLWHRSLESTSSTPPAPVLQIGQIVAGIVPPRPVPRTPRLGEGERSGIANTPTWASCTFPNAPPPLYINPINHYINHYINHPINHPIKPIEKSVSIGASSSLHANINR